MMTRNEADERARALWPNVVQIDPHASGGWMVTLTGGAFHTLDGDGRVSCGHGDCRHREAVLVRDAQAAARVELRHVIRRPLGAPPVYQVWRGARWLGTITLSADGLEVDSPSIDLEIHADRRNASIHWPRPAQDDDQRTG